MSKWIRIAALAIAAIALMMLAYAVLTPEPQTDDTDHGGMWSDRMNYSAANVGLIGISLVAIAISLMIVLLWKEYEPLPPSMGPPAHPEQVPGREKPPEESREAAPPPTPVPAQSADEEAEKNYLILRLLTGDERLMFKAIMDSGGEVLQKDLILKTRMSNAKVSRLLDKLAQKGVVTKERHGSTNKVRIKHE